MSNFEELGLSPFTCEVLNKMGFEKPTPIQEQAIPQLLTQDPTDFIGLAQTGTGKTAAFGLPLMDLVSEDLKETQALIMAPTRELGQQTAKQLTAFAANNQALNVEVVYGGANIARQITALRRPTQIVVATPGRLLDLIKRKAIDLSGVRYLVLDEADEMLNMGFKEDIDEILSYIPTEERAIWLFSATMPPDIRRIIKTYMQDPVEVAVNTKQKTNTDISHQFVVTRAANKLAAIRRFMDIQPDMRGIMFCRTKWETQDIADKLTQMGYGVEPLHGDLSQGQRDAAMRRFKARSMQLLIATDVAARGIDVDNLTHVFHHTLPDHLESYTHRSGRTGRAGNKGISLAFINGREGRKVKDLEKRIGIKMEKAEIPRLQELRSKRIAHWAHVMVNTRIDPEADGILSTVAEEFEELSKEDILKRLITTQLDHLQIGANEVDDLNEGPRKKRTPEERAQEQTVEKADGLDQHRYFINLGSMDGITTGELVHFLEDVSNIKRKHFTDVVLRKTSSYFSIASSLDKGMAAKFNGMEVEGRRIRVNRDDEGPKRSRPGVRKGGKGKPKGRPRPGGGRKPRR